MTERDVLKWLDEHVIGNLEVKEILTNAIELQIEQPVDNEWRETALYHWCPNCECEVDIDNDNWCPSCGQKLLWKESDRA